MNVMKFFMLMAAVATVFPAIAAEEHFSVPAETLQLNDDDVPQPRDGHIIGKVLDRNGVPLRLARSGSHDQRYQHRYGNEQGR